MDGLYLTDIRVSDCVVAVDMILASTVKFHFTNDYLWNEYQAIWAGSTLHPCGVISISCEIRKALLDLESDTVMGKAVIPQ